MTCIFQILDESNPELKTCTICGKEIKSKFPPEKVFARCKNSQEPSITNKVASFTKSMVDFAADGFAMETEEKAKKRLEICHNCELFKNSTCTLCGCNMSVKVKIRSSKCPLKTAEFPNGKWPIDQE